MAGVRAARGASSVTEQAAKRGAPLGLLVFDVANPFFAEVVRGAEDAARAAGHPLIVCSTDQATAAEDQALTMLEDHGVAGIVMTPAQERPRHLQLLRDRGTPVVLLDATAPEQDCCSVAVDGAKGASWVARHLLEQGHQKFAFVTSTGASTQRDDRHRGFEQGLRDAGVEPAGAVDVVPVEAVTVEAAAAAAERLLATSEATGVFCVNDIVAIGLLRGLVAQKVDVPGEVAVVGFDDVAYAALLNPALSTVRAPKSELGRAAMRLLLDEVDKPAGHIHRARVFAPQLVVRASSDG